MPRLTWGNVGERTYETGIDRGVLYLADKPGVVWNGLTSVSEEPSGGSSRSYYLDGVKYLNLSANEEFEGTISAFTYPDEFAVCEGSVAIFSGLFAMHQPRKSFGLTYRTKVGNDVDGIDHGYKLHIVYNALAEPAQRPNATLNDGSDLTEFNWRITTRPPALQGYKRTAHFMLDSRMVEPSVLAAIEDILYGTDADGARLPPPQELITLFEVNADFVVVDNEDGTWTATGASTFLTMLDSDTFQINWPDAVFIDDDTYTITTR